MSEISEDEAIQENAAEFTLAEKAALRLIARAEQCTAGLSRKLEKRKFDSVCVGKVISHLAEIGLVDDSRFARLWLQSRLRFARSPRRLLSSLCARGIDRDEAETAVKTVLDDETEAAMLARFVKKHARKADDAGHSLKFLLKSEGFSHAAIQKFFDED